MGDGKVDVDPSRLEWDKEQEREGASLGAFELPDGFVDLYVGPGFCNIKQRPGSDAPLIDIYSGREASCQALYQACLGQLEKAGDREFTFRVEVMHLRATCIQDVEGNAVFVLRHFKAIPDIQSIGLDSKVIEWLMDPRRQGLIVIAGQQASGKTSSAASILRERLRRLGGIATAVEDPVETDLNGMHGAGRCLQFPASAAEGGYPAQIALALRTGSLQTLIGEVREAEAAAQVVHASINGHLVLTTLHAGSITQAIERLCALASPKLDNNAYAIVAEGLSAVIWQEILTGRGGRAMVISRGFYLGPDDQAVRDKIRKREIPSLEGEIDRRMNKLVWQRGEF